MHAWGSIKVAIAVPGDEHTVWIRLCQWCGAQQVAHVQPSRLRIMNPPDPEIVKDWHYESILDKIRFWFEKPDCDLIMTCIDVLES